MSSKRLVEDGEGEPDDEEQPDGAGVAQNEPGGGNPESAPVSAISELVPRQVPEYDRERRCNPESKDAERLVQKPEHSKTRCEP